MINIIFYNVSEIRGKKGRKNTINQYLLRFDQCLLENRYFIEILLNVNIKYALFADNLHIKRNSNYFQIEIFVLNYSNLIFRVTFPTQDKYNHFDTYNAFSKTKIPLIQYSHSSNSA